MYTYQHEHRVRYRECDPMGVVYHTHYLDYFEAARTEALRDLGVRYRDLERNGIIMPVVSATVDYKQSAEYDDVVIVEAQFPEMPEVRVPIDYVVRRAETDTLLATGHTDLCFMNAERRRPVRIPEPVREAFLPHLPASS
ncbi:MAG: YbgC/FadM family acyl-CoA thioesterase [Bacteroidetes bacterium]|jgi:acyl-CoA thioester hydrolase|nr:YbgC/FadM family acyl-CoA thioesterase [Bacteroidota bacterium]